MPKTPDYFDGKTIFITGGTSGIGEATAKVFAREGANVEIYQDGERTLSVEGDYGAEGHIVQALHPLPDFGGNYPMIGSWLVASQPCGMCIREDTTLVTGDDARFVPHIIVG